MCIAYIDIQRIIIIIMHIHPANSSSVGLYMHKCLVIIVQVVNMSQIEDGDRRRRVIRPSKQQKYVGRKGRRRIVEEITV